MLPEKIISGAQTGADRGGLDAAIACGVPYGGYVPKRRTTGEVDAPETDEEVLNRIVDRLEAVMPDEDKAVILNGRGTDIASQRLLFEKQYIENALHYSGVTLDRALQLGGHRDLDSLVLDSIRRRYSNLWLNGCQVGVIKWHHHSIYYDNERDGDFLDESDIDLYVSERIIRRRFYFCPERLEGETCIEEDTYTSFGGKEVVDTYLDEQGGFSNGIPTPSRTYRNISLPPSKWKQLLNAFVCCSFGDWGKRYYAPESRASTMADWHVIIRSIDGDVILHSSGKNACDDKHWGFFLRLLNLMGEKSPPIFGHNGWIEEEPIVT